MRKRHFDSWSIIAPISNERKLKKGFRYSARFVRYHLKSLTGEKEKWYVLGYLFVSGMSMRTWGKSKVL